MKPRLNTYKDLEKAVDMVRVGRVRGRENVVRLIMKCFTRSVLTHKSRPGTAYSPKFRNGRGCAIEIVRNIYRFHNIK